MFPPYLELNPASVTGETKVCPPRGLGATLDTVEGHPRRLLGPAIVDTFHFKILVRKLFDKSVKTNFFSFIAWAVEARTQAKS